MAVLWLRFLTEINEDTDVVPPELLENEQIRKALSIVEKSAMTEGQYYAYERFWDQVNREHVLAEANFNDGLAQGIAQGVAQGIAQGVAEGEAKKNIEIARKMKSDHLPLDVIMKYTGLTPEEINSL
jgi:predicted transposase/invertase (TIGR01784 family)